MASECVTLIFSQRLVLYCFHFVFFFVEGRDASFFFFGVRWCKIETKRTRDRTPTKKKLGSSLIVAELGAVTGHFFCPLGRFSFVCFFSFFFLSFFRSFFVYFLFVWRRSAPSFRPPTPPPHLPLSPPATTPKPSKTR